MPIYSTAPDTFGQIGYEIGVYWAEKHPEYLVVALVVLFLVYGALHFFTRKG